MSSQTLEPPRDDREAARQAVIKAEQEAEALTAEYNRLQQNYARAVKRASQGEVVADLDTCHRAAIAAWDARMDAMRKVAEAKSAYDRLTLYRRPGSEEIKLPAPVINEPFAVTERMRFIKWMIETDKINDRDERPSSEPSIAPEPEPPAIAAREKTMAEKRGEFAVWLLEHDRLSEE